jgi:hypothetical protein
MSNFTGCIFAKYNSAPSANYPHGYTMLSPLLQAVKIHVCGPWAATMLFMISIQEQIRTRNNQL